MITWKLIEVKAKDLKPNPENAKKRDEKGFERLRKSMEKFGRVFDGIANKDLSLIDGHSRHETADPDDVLRVFVPDRQLSHQEEQEMNAIFDVAKAGIPDFELMYDKLGDDFVEEWNFTSDEMSWLKEKSGSGEGYTKKVKSPIYDPSDECPEVSELFDNTYYLELIKKINRSRQSEDVKQFLRLAATRHIVFNYERIADFYAHSNKSVQGMMEDSALVIIDFGKAIEKGFVNLSEELREQYLQDYGAK